MSPLDTTLATRSRISQHDDPDAPREVQAMVVSNCRMHHILCFFEGPFRSSQRGSVIVNHEVGSQDVTDARLPRATMWRGSRRYKPSSLRYHGHRHTQQDRLVQSTVYGNTVYRPTSFPCPSSNFAPVQDMLDVTHSSLHRYSTGQAAQSGGVLVPGSLSVAWLHVPSLKRYSRAN